MFKYIYLNEVDSTNSYIKCNAYDLSDMTVVIANKQTAGIGRTGHEWKSADYQNMTISILLKRPVDQTITQFIGFAVLKLLHEYQLKAKVKWPNDLMIGDKKICGILVESIISGNDYNVIVGIGLNVNQTDFGVLCQTATSLKCETNHQYVISDVVSDFLKLFDKYFKLYISHNLDYLSYLREHSYLLNQVITFNYQGKECEGQAIDLGCDGCLIVRIDNENIALNSGEVNKVRKTS